MHWSFALRNGLFLFYVYASCDKFESEVHNLYMCKYALMMLILIPGPSLLSEEENNVSFFSVFEENIQLGHSWHDPNLMPEPTPGFEKCSMFPVSTFSTIFKNVWKCSGYFTDGVGSNKVFPDF